MFISREKWNNLLIRVEALEFAVKNSNSTQDLVEKVSQEISLSIDKNTNVWDSSRQMSEPSANQSIERNALGNYVLTIEEMPRHTMGAELYAGRFPCGLCKKNLTAQCEQPGHWNSDHSSCFIERDDQ